MPSDPPWPPTLETKPTRPDPGPPNDEALLKAKVDVYRMPWRLRVVSRSPWALEIVSVPCFDALLTGDEGRTYSERAHKLVARAVAARVAALRPGRIEQWLKSVLADLPEDRMLVKARDVVVVDIENAIKRGGFVALQGIVGGDASIERPTVHFDETLRDVVKATAPAFAPIVSPRSGGGILPRARDAPTQPELRVAWRYFFVRDSLPWTLVIGSIDPFVVIAVPSPMYAARYVRMQDGRDYGSKETAKTVVVRTIIALACRMTRSTLDTVADDFDPAQLGDPGYAAAVCSLLKDDVSRRLKVAIDRQGLLGLVELAG
jgi:hypothetical protein